MDIFFLFFFLLTYSGLNFASRWGNLKGPEPPVVRAGAAFLLFPSSLPSQDATFSFQQKAEPPLCPPHFWPSSTVRICAS